MVTSDDSNDSPFISLLEQLDVEVSYDKNIVGFRYDPVLNHAFTLQFSDHETRVGGKEDNIHLAWTFVTDWGF